VPRPLLLDTGAWVALIDRSEERHADCVEVLENLTGPLVTTEAVLTETQHLVGPEAAPRITCLEFVLRGAVTLVPASLASLRRAAALVAEYADVPMDFADAGLVVLAEELETDRVFTLDRRGFSVYRIGGRRGFRIVP
jgi:predicted nucleic acid-binding protein